MADLGLNVNDVMSRLTIRVELPGIRSLRFRVWLGGILIALASRIIGCKFEQIKLG